MCNRLIFSLLRFKETRCSTNYQETIMKVVLNVLAGVYMSVNLWTDFNMVV